MTDVPEELLHNPLIWRGREVVPRPGSVPSSYDALDENLPDGGWPGRALIEILVRRYGSGEMQLLMPALAQLSAGDRWIAWIAPPFVPYAPALVGAGIDLERILLVHPKKPADAWWAMEQALRSGTCAAVLAWEASMPSQPVQSLRRLQLAAQEGGSHGVLFRPVRALEHSSPAALRLRLSPESDGWRLEVLKSRGGRPVTLRIP